jgi:hypothetical protein
LDKSAQGKTGNTASHSSLGEKKASSAGLTGGDSKNLSSAASLATSASNASAAAPGKAAKTAIESIPQQLSIQVALVTSLHTGDYSDGLEVKIRI